jgi:hypothetical protein
MTNAGGTSRRHATPRFAAVRRAGPPLALAAIGLLLWAAAAGSGSLRLSWSDEIVYAAMGRNIALGRGLVSSFYDAQSIEERGFPQGDVHMPGHPLLLAASFAAFGPREAAAFVPPALGLLASGLLLWAAALRMLGRRGAFGAAVLLLGFPPLSGYACSAMAETEIVCLGAAHLALWCAAVRRPTLARVLGLALLLGVGATIRETFLALLVPTLVLLWRLPRPSRGRALVAFAATLGAYVGLVLLPLYRARAPYPNYLAELLRRRSLAESALLLLRNAFENLRSLADPAAGLDIWLTRLVLVLGLLAPLAVLVLRRGRPRLLATYALTAAVATVVPVLFTYTLEGWTGLRMVLVTVPSAVCCLVALLQAVPGRVPRNALFATAVLAFFAATWAADGRLVADRRGEHVWASETSRAIRSAFDCPGPHVVVAHDAFLYGWQTPDATVVWRGALPAQTLALVASRAGVAPGLAPVRAGSGDDEMVTLGCTLAAAG